MQPVGAGNSRILTDYAPEISPDTGVGTRSLQCSAGAGGKV